MRCGCARLGAQDSRWCRGSFLALASLDHGGPLVALVDTVTDTHCLFPINGRMAWPKTVAALDDWCNQDGDQEQQQQQQQQHKTNVIVVGIVVDGVDGVGDEIDNGRQM